MSHQAYQSPILSKKTNTLASFLQRPKLETHTTDPRSVSVSYAYSTRTQSWFPIRPSRESRPRDGHVRRYRTRGGESKAEEKARTHEAQDLDRVARATRAQASRRHRSGRFRGRVRVARRSVGGSRRLIESGRGAHARAFDRPRGFSRLFVEKFRREERRPTRSGHASRAYRHRALDERHALHNDIGAFFPDGRLALRARLHSARREPRPR